MSSKKENLPNPEVLINSMRSIGYSFESAVADIVDNSVSADAKHIHLIVPVDDEEEFFLEIVDDGEGMTQSELFEAMKFGSKKDGDRNSNDLGRFGLGLKLASISQCMSFTVISKKCNIINAYCWDIDIIRKTNTWDMIELSYEDILQKTPHINKYLVLDHFTIVLWNKIDSIDKEVTVLNSYLETFNKKISIIERHLSLIFHRYLENGLKIDINGTELEPIDPFLSKHNKTTIKPEQMIDLKGSKIILQCYVLPYYKDLSNEDYHKMSINNLIDKEGFYVYRNKRLIIYGTWFRIKPRSSLSSNARIRIDIPNTYDDMWSIDVKKEKAIIPTALLEQLKTEIEDITNKSRKLHRYKGSKQTENGSIWTKVIDKRSNNVSFNIDENSPLIKNLIEKLDVDPSVVRRIFNLIELSLPYKDIYNSIAEKSEVNQIDDKQKEALLNEAVVLFKELRGSHESSDEEVLNYICSHEPYSNLDISEEVIRGIINGS